MRGKPEATRVVAASSQRRVSCSAATIANGVPAVVLERRSGARRRRARPGPRCSWPSRAAGRRPARRPRHEHVDAVGAATAVVGRHGRDERIGRDAVGQIRREVVARQPGQALGLGFEPADQHVGEALYVALEPQLERRGRASARDPPTPATACSLRSRAGGVAGEVEHVVALHRLLVAGALRVAPHGGPHPGAGVEAGGQRDSRGDSSVSPVEPAVVEAAARPAATPADAACQVSDSHAPARVAERDETSRSGRPAPPCALDPLAACGLRSPSIAKAEAGRSGRAPRRRPRRRARQPPTPAPARSETSFTDSVALEHDVGDAEARPPPGRSTAGWCSRTRRRRRTSIGSRNSRPRCATGRGGRAAVEPQPTPGRSRCRPGTRRGRRPRRSRAPPTAGCAARTAVRRRPAAGSHTALACRSAKPGNWLSVSRSATRS